MKKFDILPEEGGLRIRVIAATRAGLLSAAVQGAFAAAGPKWVQEDPVLAPVARRQFKIQAADFSSLVVDLLNQAISLASANREAYEDISFSLITDTKAEGELVGRAVRGFDKEIKSANRPGVNVEKNVVGQWQTIISFEI
jgi:hypothetical protein